MSEQTMIQTAEITAEHIVAGDLLVTDNGNAVVDGTHAVDGKVTVAVTLNNEQLSWQWNADDVVVITARENVADEELPTPVAPGPEKVKTAIRWEPSKDLSQCEYKTAKGRRCKLVVHTDDVAHKMMFREEVAQPKTLAQLRADDKTKKAFAGFSLTAEVIPADADISRQYNRPQIERDADQKKVDKDADAAYKRWVKAGSKKGTFEELAGAAGMRYIVPAAAFDTVIMMLRRATQLGAPQNGKKLSYRRAAHESGNVIVNYMITDQGSVIVKKGEENGNGN